MILELRPEHEQMIEKAIRMGSFRDRNELISAALEMLFEDIEDGLVADARKGEPHVALADVVAALRAAGKLS